jgi:hypothetical protein
VGDVLTWFTFTPVLSRMPQISKHRVDHFGAELGRCHQLSGSDPVKAVVLGRSIRFQRAIHSSAALSTGIA